MLLLIPSAIAIEEHVLPEPKPWYNNKPLLTPYHSIYIKKEYIDYIRTTLLFLKIPTIQNPTYKIFNHNYENKSKDEYFNSSILYLPTLVSMNNNERNEMIKVIQFIKKIIDSKDKTD